MAEFDRDATPGTAVAAFLAQFAISATGDITHFAGADTFHVWWLHRALQKKVWDFAILDDDNINLAKPNPSTSEALGTIITLIDHTTNYSVRYNITDTVAEYLYGGSVEQINGSSQSERYSGLIVLGSTNLAATQLQVIQNQTIYKGATPFWGTGINDGGDANTIMRILVKTIEGAGGEIDGQRVVVKATEYGDTYGVWETELGLGEKVAAITTVADPNNTTLIGTVQAYTGFAAVGATAYGYDLHDVDTLGADPFIGSLSYDSLTGNKNKDTLYEVTKAYLARGQTETWFGQDADLYTARLYQLTVTPDAGTLLYVQNEAVTWTGGGAGIMIGADNLDKASTTKIVIEIGAGVPPVNTDVIVGVTNSATNVVTANQKLASNMNYIGIYTGSNWIGAEGVGFPPAEMIFGDSVRALDGQTPGVPQNVTITVDVTCGATGDAPHVFLAKKDAGLEAPDYTTNTVITPATTYNGTGDGFVRVTNAIPDDTPKTGYIGVLRTGDTAYTFYEFSDWTHTNEEFTLVSTLAADLTNLDPIFIAFFYELASGAGLVKTAARTFVFDAGTQDYRGWVRHGDPAIPDKPVLISTNVGSNSVNIAVLLDDET
jgi:hypothetical protein